MLFPPGPLARLSVRPRALRLAPLQTRRLEARALDADGRPCSGAVELEWRLEGAGEVEAEGRAALYTAPDPSPAERGPIVVRVRAFQGEVCIEVLIPVRIAEVQGAGSAGEGIPEPCPVAAPGEPWRSRLCEGRWEYNSAHRDYLAAAEAEPRRLRYLFRLFAKEVVLQNFGRPGDAETLERMVEVLTWIDAEGRR